MNIDEETRSRGWNRKGFKYDKTSDEYKKYKDKLLKTRCKRIRKELTILAKAPVKRSNKRK